MTGARRRARLAAARLTVCIPIRDDLATFLPAIIDAGVDVIQLRDKHADGDALFRAGEQFRAAATAGGALFIVNDRLDIAQACDADGVHVGQDDLAPDVVRRLGGTEILIGRSTHSIHEIDAADGEAADYLGVGPVSATPTKPGRAGVGLALVTEAAARWRRPFYVTGGMDASTIPSAIDAGAFGVVVARAILDAEDPITATRHIRDAIDRRGG